MRPLRHYKHHKKSHHQSKSASKGYTERLKGRDPRSILLQRMRHKEPPAALLLRLKQSDRSTMSGPIHHKKAIPLIKALKHRDKSEVMSPARLIDRQRYTVETTPEAKRLFEEPARKKELNPCAKRHARREVLFAHNIAGPHLRSPGQGGGYRKHGQPC